MLRIGVLVKVFVLCEVFVPPDDKETMAETVKDDEVEKVEIILELALKDGVAAELKVGCKIDAVLFGEREVDGLGVADPLLESLGDNTPEVVPK